MLKTSVEPTMPLLTGMVASTIGTAPRRPAHERKPISFIGLRNGNAHTSTESGLATKVGSEVLRVLVYGGMPDLVRRKFDFPWSNGDRVAFAAVCGALRGSGPAIRRGFLADAFPEGTPHLDPKDPTRVIVAGPSRAQRQARDDARTAA